MPTPDLTLVSALVPVLAQETGFSARQVESTLTLLGEGATVPFIARYRKEATGSLDEAQIRDPGTPLARPAGAGGAPRNRAGLDPRPGEAGRRSWRSRIRAAATRTELEDLYLPYRPSAARGPTTPGRRAWNRWPRSLAETDDPRAAPLAQAARS